jgi:hypothetical protein
LLRKPVIVGLSSGYGDVLGVDAVELGGFDSLRIVPNDHAIGPFVD